MTNTEVGLITALAAIVAVVLGVFLGGRGKVPVSYCTLKHEGLENLLNQQFTGVNERLRRIEKSLGGIFRGSRNDDDGGT